MKTYSEKITMFKACDGQYFKTEGEAIRSSIVTRVRELTRLADDLVLRVQSKKDFASLREDFEKMSRISIEIEEVILANVKKEMEDDLPF